MTATTSLTDFAELSGGKITKVLLSTLTGSRESGNVILLPTYLYLREIILYLNAEKKFDLQSAIRLKYVVNFVHFIF